MYAAAAFPLFTPAARVVIDDLCKDLTRRIQRTVKADYGQTDCGQVHDVALCVESLPEVAQRHPGPLVSILAGPGVAGDFVVLGADGAPVAEGIGLGHAVTAARLSGVRSYRKMV
jgi:hypothetical protein